MSHAAQEQGDVSDPQAPSEGAAARVWQACQSCRRKKVKCDGKRPCHNCSSRGHACEFPEAKDHASVSRYYASSLEARCQHMDSVCQRLEGLAKALSQATEALTRASASHTDGRLSDDLIQAANVLRSFPIGATEIDSQQQHHLDTPGTNQTLSHGVATADPFEDEISPFSDVDEERVDSAQNEQDFTGEECDDQHDPAGALVTDSYGRLRFVGGATNKMLIDAAKTLSPLTQIQTPNTGTVNAETGETPRNADVELPLFVRGKIWPELPFLPKPEQLPRPPQYISDILIGLYFDKLHYTFPVIFKPHFMDKYGKMLRGGVNGTQDKDFLMVFFAVCACASGLLPTPSEKGFPGLEYYEKALLMHYASPGQASWENVQCLALLAMCAASWNTLTRSWSLAGQAVRSAMDIGLHLSNRYVKAAGPQSAATLAAQRLHQQIARRTWWSIYCMERVVSICLGRPMAVQERDCSCELPLDLSDEELERHCSGGVVVPIAPAGLPRPLTGFLAFARLCQISGRIQQLGSPLRLRRPSAYNAERTAKYLERVSTLDQALREWLDTLPDAIRFSANDPNAAAAGDSGLVMCVIIFIAHAGSLLNLYRDLVYYLSRFSKDAANNGAMSDATAQCMSAAKSCINAAELVRDLVPPSHYLAICVHSLTLSGVALLRMSGQPLETHVIVDAEKCAGYLKDLEFRWSGAGRSRAIVEHLISECRRHHAVGIVPGLMSSTGSGIVTPVDHRPSAMMNKRSFAEMDGDSGLHMEDILWGDSMPWFDLSEAVGSAPFAHWNGI